MSKNTNDSAARKSFAELEAQASAKPLGPFVARVVAFTPLANFSVEGRPLANKRLGGFREVPNWTQNAKLLRAAERLHDKNHTSYVEDGDTNYKVRLKAS